MNIFERLEAVRLAGALEGAEVSGAEAIEFLQKINPGLMAVSPQIVEELRKDLENYLNGKPSGVGYKD